MREYSSIPGVQALGGLQEEETNRLLMNAAGLFFPSLYEGFGLPPVEAAVLGTPVAVSRIPPHEEGLTDLDPSEVLWVHPKDLHGWVGAFHKIAKSEVAPTSTPHQNQVLDRFSLARMGQSMDQIYRDVLGSSS